ncbi:MAG: NAD-dependent epimerase/dehydratase family protein [Pseudomonadota bacterium]
MTVPVALVTGASGFVGRYLCERLQRDGMFVRGLFRSSAAGPWDECVLADLADGVPDDALAGVTHVFHLAGRAHAMALPNAAAAHTRATVVATERLLEACAAGCPQSLVYLSSTKAVADPGARVADERWTAAPGDAYGVAKRRAEDHVFAFGVRHRIPVAVLRPPMVLGAGVKGNAARLLDRAMCGRSIPLPEFGNPRSMVHVLDLVAALIRVSELREPRQRCYFVAHPEPFTTRELIDHMRAVGGFPSREPVLPGWMWGLAAGCAEALARVGGATLRERMPLDWERFQRLREPAQFDASLLEAETGFVAARGWREAIADMVQARSTTGSGRPTRCDGR